MTNLTLEDSHGRTAFHISGITAAIDIVSVVATLLFLTGGTDIHLCITNHS